jgi:flagellar hook-associated protein 2
MPVSFSGIASGIDTANIVRQLTNIERGSVRRYERKKVSAEQSVSAFGDLKTKLTTLRDIVKDMADPDTFGKLSATTSDDKVLGITADGAAAQGTYEIEVQQLAKNTKVMSDSFSSKTGSGLFGEGTLTIEVGGESSDFTIDGDTTLTILKDAINSSGGEFVASIVNDGEGYRLFVQGKNTGAENAVTFTEAGGLTLEIDKPANSLSSAQDARILIDGALTVTSADNILEDVIEGLELDLQKVDSSFVTIEISRDTDSQIKAFTGFVDAYNDVAKFIRSKMKPSKVGRRSDLVNDPTMGTIRRQLQGFLQTSVDNNSVFTNLAQVGFQTKQDGTIKLDTSDLKDALGKDFQGVLGIFTTDSDGLADKFETMFDNVLKLDGLLDNRTDSLADRIKGLNKSIDRQNILVDAFEARLEAQFLIMEQAISRLNTQSGALGNRIGIYR